MDRHMMLRQKYYGVYIRSQILGFLDGPKFYIYDNGDINGVNELNKKSYDDYKERKLIQSKKWIR